MAEEHVERCIEAARRVLLGEGVSGVTFDAVAAAAGLAVEEVEACFDDRGDMLHELNLFCMENAKQQVHDALAPTTTAEHTLAEFFRHAVTASDDDLEEFRLSAHASQVLDEMRGRRTREQSERYLKVGNGMIDMLEAKLLADWGDDMLPHGVHTRRVAFVAQLLAQGFLNMKSILRTAGRSILHGDDDLIAMMSHVMSAPPRMIRQLTALNDVSRELASMRSEEELLDRVPHMLTEAFDFDRCTLLMDGANGLDIVAAAWTKEDERRLVRELMEDGLLKPPPHLRRCVAEDRTIFVPDPQSEPDWPKLEDERARDAANKSGWWSPTLFTPLRCDGKPVGLMLAHAHLRWRPMDAQDISRVEAFAAMVGVALQNVRLLENLNALVEERTRELRNTQAQLVQSEKMAALGKLVAGVAHELNTPLGAVTSSRDSMAKGAARIREVLDEELPDAKGNAKLSRALEIIDRAGDTIAAGTERIDGIVTRLRSFARLDQADLQEVRVEDCIRDALGLLEPTLDTIDVTCAFADTPRIRCYPAQLNQVFLNVLTNAVESMDAGTIRVSTRSMAEGVVVVVQDEGHGIAAEDLERVFDPGFTTRGVGVGTGLGLAIAFRIVRDHGGEITIDSAPDRGTTVTITLATRFEERPRG